MSDEPLYTPIPEASAPVQQSTLSPKDDEENYSLSDPDAGIYQKITEPGAGGLYDIDGKFLGNPAVQAVDLDAVKREAETSAAQKRIEASDPELGGKSLAEVKAINEKNDARNRYDLNVQKLLIDRLDEVQKHSFGNMDASSLGGENIRKLNSNIPAGTYTNRIGMESSRACGAFINATPAQLAMLQPMLRFFMIDEGGNHKEITFGDYSSAEVIKQLADLRRTGTLADTLRAPNLRGSLAGIKSFSWNYFNRHEGNRIIEAQLQLYFGSLTELANEEYLELIFMNGVRNALSQKLDEDSRKNKKSMGKYLAQNQKEAIKNLTNNIERYQNTFKKGKVPDDLVRLTKASARREYKQLKVLVGWSVPKGSERAIKGLFSSPEGYTAFKDCIKKNQRVITLQLTNYNIDFSQDGTASLTIDYVGSTDNYLASNGADIFGFFRKDKFNGSTKFMRTPIDVPLSVLPTKNTKDILRAQDSYYLRYIAKGQDLPKDENNQEVVRVTLEGIVAAEGLVAMQKRKLQLEGVATGPALNAINKRQKLLALIREQARFRSMSLIYSNFIEQMFEEGTDIFKARVIYTKRKGFKIPNIVWDSAVIAEADIKERMKQAVMTADRRRRYAAAAAAAQGSVDPAEILEPLPTNDNLDFYYMRLGDILKTAMRTSGFKDEIGLILGNASQPQGEFSLYDIPITLGTFGQFFYDKVIQTQRRLYPFRNFLEDILDLGAKLINLSSFNSTQLAYDTTMIISETKMPTQFVLDSSDLSSIAAGQSMAANFVAELGDAYQSDKKLKYYYVVFTQAAEEVKRSGIKSRDLKEGIYHYVIGSDRGLVKSFDFSRMDTKYFQEMLIESENAEDLLEALFLPQNVNLDMFGNGLHRNGDLIFVDSRAALGSYAGPILGIGGYYRVVKVYNKIDNRGFTTKIDCVFVRRADRPAPNTD